MTMRAWRILCDLDRGREPAVTLSQFHAFLREQVQPRFGAFTVHRTNEFSGTKSERSAVIEIVEGSSASEREVLAIASAYERQFSQQAVLVVASDADAPRV
jgi:hypothetical protein